MDRGLWRRCSVTRETRGGLLSPCSTPSCVHSRRGKTSGHSCEGSSPLPMQLYERCTRDSREITGGANGLVRPHLLTTGRGRGSSKPPRGTIDTCFAFHVQLESGAVSILSSRGSSSVAQRRRCAHPLATREYVHALYRHALLIVQFHGKRRRQINRSLRTRGKTQGCSVSRGTVIPHAGPIPSQQIFGTQRASAERHRKVCRLEVLAALDPDGTGRRTRNTFHGKLPLELGVTAPLGRTAWFHVAHGRPGAPLSRVDSRTHTKKSWNLPIDNDHRLGSSCSLRSPIEVQRETPGVVISAESLRCALGSTGNR